MIFNTWEFAVFAALFLTVYGALVPRRTRGFTLVLGGLVFYAASSIWYTLLIVGLAIVTFVLARMISSSARQRTARRRLLLSIGIVLITGTLAFFKYTNFFIGAISPLCARLCAGTHVDLMIPLAISFFTFEFVHFLVDVYLGKIQIVRAGDFAQFALFFPTLVAGPIKRYQNFAPQIGRQTKIESLIVAANVYRVLLGLAKKAIIADSMTPLIQPLLSGSPLYGQLDYWSAVVAYAAKIYFDFTGYSDIAIGLAALLGFAILENFDRPYWSANISEFWRRWHISLSSWIRDYIFIPIGGSRQGRLRTTTNLAVVMAAAGLWHGAAWHFVVWGLWHGAGLGIHRLWQFSDFGARFRNVAAMRPVSIAATFAFVCLGWVLFASPSLQIAGKAFVELFGGTIR